MEYARLSPLQWPNLVAACMCGNQRDKVISTLLPSFQKNFFQLGIQMTN